MKIALYTDNTLPLALNSISKLLNTAFKKIKFVVGQERLQINVSHIVAPEIYENLPSHLLQDVAKYDYAVMSTNVPYENNFFFEGSDDCVLISFNRWNVYTHLPLTNGLVYFVTALLTDLLDIGHAHDQYTGCINDFWWDKRTVHLGMQAAFICSDCRDEYTGDPRHLQDMDNLLDLIRKASRAGQDLIDIAPMKSGSGQTSFDVFLCHNGKDKATIRKINAELKSAGIKTWLDEDQLLEGKIWQDELQKQIRRIRNVCVFVGKNGRSPWQDVEIRAFLNKFVSKGCRVIPVLLPDAPKLPNLPIFLEQFQWVDLRRSYRKNFSRMVAALKG